MIKKLSILLLVVSLFACSKPDGGDSAGGAAVNNGAGNKTAAPAMVEKFTEGVHYASIATPIQGDSDKIVVTEFFWYGCPHCEAFEPFLSAWDKQKPADVILQRSPAIWHDAMKLHAKLFFMAQALENSEALHAALFKEVIAIRAEPDLLVQSRKFAEVFARFGMNEEEFKKQLESAAVEEQMIASIALMKQAGVAGTPAIVVNGKYLVLNDGAGGLEGIMAIADFLIAKERSKQ